MICTPFRLGEHAGFICRARPRRALCVGCRSLQHIAALCDHPVPAHGRKKSLTCDAKLCERCRIRKDEELDACPEHAKIDPPDPWKPMRGTKRIHIESGVAIWALSLDEHQGEQLVTFARVPPDSGGCTHLQTVPLAKWVEKTKAPWD